MSSTKPTIYICYDKNCVETSYQILTHLDQKFGRSYNIMNMSIDNEDFHIITLMISEVISEYNNNYGIIISDYGMYSSMITNRNKNIRAIVCLNENMVDRAINEYDMNILCIPHKIVEWIDIEKMVNKFINTKRNHPYSPKSFLLERL